MWAELVAPLLFLCGLTSAVHVGVTNLSHGDICPRSPLQSIACRRPVVYELGKELRNLTEVTSPWTFPPQCVTPIDGSAPLCVFTSQEFDNGRGISIVTSPRLATNIQSLKSFEQSGKLTEAGRLVATPFEVRDLPGRGKGGIANTTLHRGDRLLAATPALLIDTRLYLVLSQMEGIELERIAVRQLPQRASEMFWELHNQPRTGSVRDRISVNAFAVDVGGGTFSGVVLETSRFNHDCRPNTGYYFDEETLTHYTHASTDIAPGTEISVTYISPLGPRVHRQRQLGRAWGFKCTCSQCSMHPKMVKQSDMRVAHINNMTELVFTWHARFSNIIERPDALDQDSEPPMGPYDGPDLDQRQKAKYEAAHAQHLENIRRRVDAMPVLTVAEAIETSEAIISLLHQERLHVYASDIHLVASMAYCAEGRGAQAIKHAQLSLETGLVHEGLDDALHEDIMQISENPASHPCWQKKAAVEAALSS
ncbi:SET domain-containingprotein [Purpureocillium lavendulum]|uniref:SET domain-containingprotein n=1 Tax=Purpureocillium lavendulum TaxID=1247861 RepID=A0AB34G2Q3_9HYPO|nr:SET domain-containingprotein [Purpureocillium lavendulum]